MLSQSSMVYWLLQGSVAQCAYVGDVGQHAYTPLSLLRVPGADQTRPLIGPIWHLPLIHCLPGVGGGGGGGGGGVALVNTKPSSPISIP